MTEQDHFGDVVSHVMSDDTTELGKMKAELSYALFSLEREISIAQNAQAKLEAIKKIVYTPTRMTKHRTAQDHYQADFDAIRAILR